MRHLEVLGEAPPIVADPAAAEKAHQLLGRHLPGGRQGHRHHGDPGEAAALGQHREILDHDVVLENPGPLRLQLPLRGGRMGGPGLVHGDDPTRPQYPHHLAQQTALIGNVMEGVVDQNAIDRGIGEGQPQPVIGQEGVGHGGAGVGAPDEELAAQGQSRHRDIHRYGLAAVAMQEVGGPAGARAEIQHAVSGAQPQPVQQDSQIEEALGEARVLAERLAAQKVRVRRLDKIALGRTVVLVGPGQQLLFVVGPGRCFDSHLRSEGKPQETIESSLGEAFEARDFLEPEAHGFSHPAGLCRSCTAECPSITNGNSCQTK